MSHELVKFWFEFGKECPLPIGVGRGCGVTARDQEDALELLKQVVFSGAEVPPVEQVVEDVDVSRLDRDHILPNMGDVLNRGVWYPLGYD